MTYTNNTNRGHYKPKYPKKYRGDVNNIVFRSQWEHFFMVWCDKRESVLEWGSEEIIIPYRSPVDNKMHRYFVDFYVKMRKKDGSIKKYWIEIKPYRFTQKPEIPKRKTPQFMTEVMNWGVNQAKWEAAREYAQALNCQFIVLTEHELGFGKTYK